MELFIMIDGVEYITGKGLFFALFLAWLLGFLTGKYPFD
jgi:hypothetical protein